MRTPNGIAHRGGDYLLDLFVSPARAWSEKDRDEFDAACELGILSDDDRTTALRERDRMVARIEQRAEPFDDESFERWSSWRPDPSWDVPHLRLTPGGGYSLDASRH